MVKKSIIQRSINKYRLSKTYTIKRRILKIHLKKMQNLLLFFKVKAYFQLLPKNSSFIRFNNFCWKTGRNKGYYRDFGLSRHVIREMAHNCDLPGIVKASW